MEASFLHIIIKLGQNKKELHGNRHAVLFL